MENLLMQQHSAHEWTGFGYFARLTFARGAPVTVKLEVCPYRIFYLSPLLFVGHDNRAIFERVFFAHLAQVDSLVGPGVAIGDVESDGCAPITEAPNP